MRMGGVIGRNSVVMIPVPALAAELKLNAKQQKDINNIQDKLRTDMRAIFQAGRGPGGPGMGGPGGPPRPGGPNVGRPGGPGGPGRMGGPGGMAPASLKKYQDLSNKATNGIEAVLTPAQKKQLPGALKEIGVMRQAGIPVETLGDLKLTSTQRTKIASISDQAQKTMAAKMQAANGDYQSLGAAFQQSQAKTRASVQAVLTAPQKAVIAKYEKDHPRRGFGGGGFGGGGGGGRRGGGPGGPGGRPGV